VQRCPSCFVSAASRRSGGGGAGAAVIVNGGRNLLLFATPACVESTAITAAGSAMDTTPLTTASTWPVFVSAAFVRSISRCWRWGRPQQRWRHQHRRHPQQQQQQQHDPEQQVPGVRFLFNKIGQRRVVELSFVSPLPAAVARATIAILLIIRLSTLEYSSIGTRVLHKYAHETVSMPTS
jgi:hypothetical protein